MRMMVFAVPAVSGGALTILHKYYDFAKNDIANEWIFILSTPTLKECKNVKVYNYPWIKKSWLHRLYFDNMIAHKLVEEHEVDEILSLQNVLVPRVKIKQTLYLHQPLPFAAKQYGIFENFTFWLYQNIISEIIFKAIKEADKVIVQTKWIMDLAIAKTKAAKEKFILIQPELGIEIKKFYKEDIKENRLFFYPASGAEYKNHEIIIKACRLLKDKLENNFRIIFTLKGDENKHIKKLREIVLKENLPIDFLGPMKIENVYEFYSKSVLIFPSFIETFGLPLLEAKMHRSPILASDCAFSHEILDEYNRVSFFNPFDSYQLAELMRVELVKTELNNNRENCC